MPDSSAFQFVSEQLGERTALETIEARGTVRIALKQAGLSARDVTPEQMVVVLDRVLPLELDKRGISDAEVVCQELAARVLRLGASRDDTESPETIFERIGKAR